MEAGYRYGVQNELRRIETAGSLAEGKAIQTLSYSPRGQVTEAEDGRGGRTAFGLDGWGRVTAVHTAEGGTERYAYDYAGNLTGSVDAEGNGTAYAYDSRGNVCRITGPDGKSLLFAYDREGRLKRRTDRNGTVTEYRYNVDGRPVLEACTDRKGNRQVMGVWEYDSLGQLRKSAGGGRCYTYAYRPDGKLLEKRENGRRLLTCSYYRNGSLRSLKDVTGRTARYEYDGEGRLSCLKEEDGKELASYEYTAAGRLSAVRTTAGLCASYRYDGDGNLVHLTLGEDQSGDRLYDVHLSYDLNGNRTGRKGTRLGADGKVQEVETRYRYDFMDRLTEEDRKGEGERYAYDLNGNRTRKEHFQTGGVDWAETYCYNERNQLTERRGREGVSQYLYDPEGNLLKEKNGEKESVYRYDLLNRQTYLRTMEGREQENRYDGEGLRAGTVENGKAYTFLYHDGELLAECDGEGAPISRYVGGHGLSHIQTMGDSRYHACHRDEQGSTAYLTGEDGSVENSYLYDAFGNGLESLEGIRNRIKYTGQQYDPETGQYYLRARYYNPLIGRFTQEDTYRGDGLNLYAYCGNNPVIYYDPSGLGRGKPEYYHYDKSKQTYSITNTDITVPTATAKSTTVGENSQSTVYRVIRTDENPDLGLSPKKPDRNMSITGHVQSGTTNKGSQYISTTTDLEVAQTWAKETNNRIVEIDLESLPEGNRVYDLSTEQGRDTYLNNARAKGFAKASSEVLIAGDIPPEGVNLIQDQPNTVKDGDGCK